MIAFARTTRLIALPVLAVISSALSAQGSTALSGSAGSVSGRVTVDYSADWQLVDRDQWRETVRDRNTVVVGGVIVSLARVSAYADGIVARSEGGALAAGGTTIAAEAIAEGGGDMSFTYTANGTGTANVKATLSAVASIGSMSNAGATGICWAEVQLDTSISFNARAFAQRTSQGSTPVNVTTVDETESNLTSFDLDVESECYIYASATNGGPPANQLGVQDMEAVAWTKATITLN